MERRMEQMRADARKRIEGEIRPRVTLEIVPVSLPNSIMLARSILKHDK